mgnify:FL=1
MALFSVLESISDPVLRYLTYSVLTITGLVLLLLLQVIAYRIISVYQDRNSQVAKNIWRPVLAEMMVADPVTIPDLKKIHQHAFLREWNRFHTVLRGDAHKRMQKLARKTRLDILAHKYIERGGMRELLQGIVTLGHMQDYSIWNRLIDLVDSEHPVISLTAAQALVDIDSKNAMKFLIPFVVKRRDWPIARVAMLLNSADPAELFAVIEDAINTAPVEDIPFLLKFLGTSHFDPAIRNICLRLGSSEDSRIISACIDAAKDANGLEIARNHVANPAWHVRLHVAKTLGRLGTVEDVGLLVQLLSDPEWWVRYRSAQAISSMPFISVDDMQKICDESNDRYARDIMAQVISEREWSQ